MWPITQLPLKAAASILYGRVITVSAANTGATATAATVVPIGISNQFTRMPPGTETVAGEIAAAGDPLPYIGQGRMALAFVGAGGVTGGSRVEAGAAGAVVALGAAGAGKWSVGIAQDDAPASSYVWVWVNPTANQA